MPNEYEQSHNRCIIQQEENQRLFKIEEYKLYSQKHIAPYFPFYKGEHTLPGNRQWQDTQYPCTDSRWFLYRFFRHSYHHAPMQTQM